MGTCSFYPYIYFTCVPCSISLTVSHTNPYSNKSIYLYNRVHILSIKANHVMPFFTLKNTAILSVTAVLYLTACTQTEQASNVVKTVTNGALTFTSYLII